MMTSPAGDGNHGNVLPSAALGFGTGPSPGSAPGRWGDRRLSSFLSRGTGPPAALPAHGLPVESWRPAGGSRWRREQQQRQQQRRRSRSCSGWSRRWCYGRNKRRCSSGRRSGRRSGWRSGRGRGPDLPGTPEKPHPEKAPPPGTHPNGSAHAQGGAAVAAGNCLHPPPQGCPGAGGGPG